MVFADPLPSWNEGAAKMAILDFIARITDAQGPDYVPVKERIAVFDNDGTLWCEYPLPPQVYFVLDQLSKLAQLNPELRRAQPYKAFLERDLKTIASFSKHDALLPAFATHAGMATDELDAAVHAWFETAVHPARRRSFTQCTYRPQLELLEHLRGYGFKSFIVTGGGVEFVRVVCQRLYGIAPERVIGSSTKAQLDLTGGHALLRKLPDLNSFNDRDEKAVNIGLHIGRRPILAFGNSDGDLAMLRYTLAGTGARLGLLLHHDDGDREFTYDRSFRVSPLSDGLDRYHIYGIRLVSMRGDWRRVFV